MILLNFDRYDAALERKTKILEIIRSLDLPNNPLDDIIDQVVIACLIHPLPLKNICIYHICTQQNNFSLIFKIYL